MAAEKSWPRLTRTRTAAPLEEGNGREGREKEPHSQCRGCGSSAPDLAFSLSAVPSPQQKTLADYIEGILVIDVDDSNNRRRSRTAAAAVNGGINSRNLSPNLLRRKIEELKGSDER